jgi:hypothetical protein
MWPHKSIFGEFYTLLSQLGLEVYMDETASIETTMAGVVS